MNERKQRLEAVFHAAMDLDSPVERVHYLAEACKGDSEFRREVDGLLQSAAGADAVFQAGQDACRADNPAPAAVLTEKPGDRIGRYKLLQKIGEGGMGVVYMAEQTEPVIRKVALKIIKLGMDTRQVIARFEAERQALALMDHPHIAKILDAGATDSGRPYFVMELVQGVPITEFCDQNQFSAEDRIKLFIPVCQAIQSAHQKGIIHRDLKPSNVLVTLKGGVPHPMVIDFGVAKATNQKLTEKTLFTNFATMIGTPAYMSPDQAGMSQLDVDTRSDIYSLGVMLYELLTGTTPFPEKRLRSVGYGEMQRIIVEEEPDRPSTRLTKTLAASSTLAPGKSAFRIPHSAIDPDLDWIVMKCLEKDRARRFETANGLASDIQRHLNNEAVLARPPSAAYRFQKLVRRNKLAFAAASAVAVALVIGLGTATVMFFRERLARNGEQQQRLEAQSAQKVADAQARKASKSEEKSRRLLYAADMNLAQQTLKLNNLGRARRLLERHRPRPGEDDLRGWEWRYLWQLTRSSALVTLTNRTAQGYAVSFSPDGSQLAVGWDDGHVDLWDVRGRRWVRALAEREYRQPGRVAFSPVHNLLAATSDPKVVTLYDLDTDRDSILWQAPDQGAWEVRDLAFSPDGSKVVIYAGIPSQPARSTPAIEDEVWVLNVSSSTIESHHLTTYSGVAVIGAAQLSPDNRRLYLARSDALNYRYSIQCIDLSTGQELWETKHQRDYGLTTLALSPDGRVLASGSGFEDPTISIWDAATGLPLRRLEGHTSWVSKLAFTRDGRRLISASTDQTIRFWDTNTWTEARILRGHTDQMHTVAISESAQLLASTGNDGNLMLWEDNGKSVTDGYNCLPENLRLTGALALDHSRLLLLPLGKPPELVELKRDSAPRPLLTIGSSSNILGWFGTNILCRWNGSNQIVVNELRGVEFIQRGAIALDSGTPPTGFAYNATRQLLAWTEGTSSTSVYLASLASPALRIELKSDVPGLVPFGFSEDGNCLAATSAGTDSLIARSGRSGRWKGVHSLRAWNVKTGQIVVSNDERIHDAIFAAGPGALVVATQQGFDHEIGFYDLAHPEQPARRVPGRNQAHTLAVSPDGCWLALSTRRGVVRLFDVIKGEWIEDLHGHLNAAFGIAFSPDGRRLISASGGREAIKLWDVGTRQELLTLGGTGSALGAARWSADGDVILAGAPWQAWSAPSWEEIAVAEAKEKTQK